MRDKVIVGLVGDYDASVLAHQAIPLALRHAATALQTTVEFAWLATDGIHDGAQLATYDGLWCVPASPYRSMAGALLAIRYARENKLPFLGSCGGFQHAVLEYARNVLGWADAEHGETNPAAARAVITPLQCALVEATDVVRLFAHTKLAAAYQAKEAIEGYRCRYGVNPEFQAALTAGPLRAAADDASGELRAIELDDHPFFVATLFQPERAALNGQAAPLVTAFVAACGSRAEG